MYHRWCEKKGAKKVLKFSHNFHTFLGTKSKKEWKNCEKSHQKPHPPFWEMVLLPKSCEKSVKKSHQKSHQKPHQNHTFQKRTLWYTQVRSTQDNENTTLIIKIKAISVGHRISPPLFEFNVFKFAYMGKFCWPYRSVPILLLPTTTTLDQPTFFYSLIRHLI